MPKKSRKTMQKEQIEAATCSFTGFFTADELFARLKKGSSGMGIATVYRSLKSLCREGKVHSYSCGKKRLYSSKNESHCHFICHKCGSVEHFRPGNIDFMKEGCPGQACHFQLDVHGTCSKCAGKSSG